MLIFFLMPISKQLLDKTYLVVSDFKSRVCVIVMRGNKGTGNVSLVLPCKMVCAFKEIYHLN